MYLLDRWACIKLAEAIKTTLPRLTQSKLPHREIVRASSTRGGSISSSQARPRTTYGTYIATSNLGIEFISTLIGRHKSSKVLQYRCSSAPHLVSCAYIFALLPVWAPHLRTNKKLPCLWFCFLLFVVWEEVVLNQCMVIEKFEEKKISESVSYKVWIQRVARPFHKS
jgi:hypothetical protein